MGVASIEFQMMRLDSKTSNYYASVYQVIFRTENKFFPIYYKCYVTHFVKRTKLKLQKIVWKGNRRKNNNLPTLFALFG